MKYFLTVDAEPPVAAVDKQDSGNVFESSAVVSKRRDDVSQQEQVNQIIPVTWKVICCLLSIISSLSKGKQRPKATSLAGYCSSCILCKLVRS